MFMLPTNFLLLGGNVGGFWLGTVFFYDLYAKNYFDYCSQPCDLFFSPTAALTSDKFRLVQSRAKKLTEMKQFFFGD